MKKVKQKTRKKHGMLIFAVGVTVLAVIYIAFAIYFQNHFCFGTTLDGFSVGGYNAEKTEELIRKEIQDYSLTLLEREDGREVIAGSSMGITPVFSGEVEGLIKEQNGFLWIVTLFQKENLEMDKIVAYDETALDEALAELSCVRAENQREPVDASYSPYIANEGYLLVPADYGTTIDKDALKKAVQEAVLVLAEELDMDAEGCYVEPAVGDDNPKLLSLLEKMNSYVGMTVTYEFGDETEVLDGDIINEWIVEENLSASLDQEAVLSYVQSVARQYNTAYRPKTLETSYGTTVTISNGFYGWKIDSPAETEQLLADLEVGESVKREPVYSQVANSWGENDYGDSYVEINLTAQHLFLYENGNLVVDSDFVSGNVAKGHASPTGAFGLTYKTRDAVLRGPDYETPVKYWMPFAGDVGMHDASWRRSFGGAIYLTNGSHGCINLPAGGGREDL